MKPKTQTVYKVVRRSKRGLLHSALVTNRRVRLRYEPGVDTVSPDSRLPLAFGSLPRAARFQFMHGGYAGGVGDLEVWEADATGVRDQYKVACGWHSLALVKRFWANPNDLTLDTGQAPAGCVSCQTIRLVRKVA